MRGRPRRLDPPPPGITRREIIELSLNVPTIERILREWVIKAGLVPADDFERITVSFEIGSSRTGDNELAVGTVQLMHAVVSYRKEDEHPPDEAAR